MSENKADLQPSEDQYYIGVEFVKAEPMTLGQYNKRRGWDIPKDEDPDRPGYMVSFIPQKNETEKADYDHEVKISWRPKEMFDANYLPTGKGEGAYLTRVRFNPSHDDLIDFGKRVFAMMIDKLNEDSLGNPDWDKRQIARAKTAIEDAALLYVKAITSNINDSSLSPIKPRPSSSVKEVQ